MLLPIFKTPKPRLKFAPDAQISIMHDYPNEHSFLDSPTDCLRNTASAFDQHDRSLRTHSRAKLLSFPTSYTSETYFNCLVSKQAPGVAPNFWRARETRGLRPYIETHEVPCADTLGTKGIPTTCLDSYKAEEEQNRQDEHAYQRCIQQIPPEAKSNAIRVFTPCIYEEVYSSTVINQIADPEPLDPGSLKPSYGASSLSQSPYQRSKAKCITGEVTGDEGRGDDVFKKADRVGLVDSNTVRQVFTALRSGISKGKPFPTVSLAAFFGLQQQLLQPKQQGYSRECSLPMLLRSRKSNNDRYHNIYTEQHRLLDTEHKIFTTPASSRTTTLTSLSCPSFSSALSSPIHLEAKAVKDRANDISKIETFTVASAPGIRLVPNCQSSPRLEGADLRCEAAVCMDGIIELGLKQTRGAACLTGQIEAGLNCGNRQQGKTLVGK
ncbi:unnamed protein product [Protopolystoma xenopodis]|uniref:Uncharacterized protein n=1 Tax=Protopolystoma xenopodis TaxID=117903 RepID=A0A448WS90_9PLAT|nr:unnamed protein product [Protopolystoma xenopodis]